MKLLSLIAPAAALLAAGSASAHTAILPATSRLTAGLVLLDTDYETDNDNEFSTEGNLLFAGYKAAINRSVSIGGGVGFLLDGELSGDASIEDGSGFRLAIDADAALTNVGKSELLGTAGFLQDRFKFSENNVDAELSTTQLAIGVLLRHQINKLSLHGGLQIFLVDSGELETTVAGNSGSTDIERDDKLNLRLGLAFAATPSVDVRLDLLAIGEQSVVLAADIAL